MQTESRPPAFHIMAKPAGARCNLRCAYCFFLRKERLYPGGTFRMSDETMEKYIRQTIEAHSVPEVTIAWQGGEPALMGLDFFRHAVEIEKNILCTVNAANSRQPLQAYRFFRDEIRARYLQFIPIVERDNDDGFQNGARVTGRSVRPGQYGRFLIEIFDEWVRRDVGTMFVQLFDGVLASYVRGTSTLCVLQPSCGLGVALEHNGDVYSCDHFVEPGYLLGNIHETPLGELVASDKQIQFGLAKSSTLPRHCRECRFLFTCHGECPKNRVLAAPDGEPALNWLCEGLKAFFAHTEKPMRIMADLLRSGRNADEIMKMQGQEKKDVSARTGRNKPCPCGSGRKYKRCHGA